MKIPDKLKSLTGDFMYSMMGLIVMNGVIQLVLYPFFNRQLGADQFGVVLTLISLVAIMGSTFGTAANYSRMVTSMKEHDSNGDYNIFLCMIAVLSVLVSAAGLLWLKQFSVIVWIGYLALMIFTVLVWLFAGTKRKISRKEGIIMALTYLVYCGYIIIR